CSFHVHRILGRELYTKSVRTASVNERIKSILQSSRTSAERGPRSAKTLRLRTIARNTRTLSRKETQSLLTTAMCRLRASLHLLRRNVFLVRGDVPNVTERIDHRSHAVAIEFVLQCFLHRGA